MKKKTKPLRLTTPKPNFVPPAKSKKKVLKCIPIELYNIIKENHPEYWL